MEAGGLLTDMLFKAREKPTLAARLRLMLWPRSSIARSALYVWKRLFRLRASPHAIGIGCAAGVFASITPLIGVQMIMAGALALVLGGSLAAAMLATFVGNPLTWPFIWAATYALGSLIIGGPAEAAVMPLTPERIGPVVYTMLVGSIPLGLLAAALSYRISVGAVEAVRRGADPLKLPDLWKLGTRWTASWRALQRQFRPAWRLW